MTHRLYSNLTEVLQVRLTMVPMRCSGSSRLGATLSQARPWFWFEGGHGAHSLVRSHVLYNSTTTERLKGGGSVETFIWEPITLFWGGLTTHLISSRYRQEDDRK
jgi:hypothetical protein